MTSTTTVFGTIARTYEITIIIRSIVTRGRTRITLEIKGVSTPALSTIFDSSVRVVVACRETFLDCHSDAVVENYVGEDASC